MSNVVNSVSIIATLESKLEIIANFTIPFNNQSRNITYDNTVSGLEATNVEAALNKLAIKPNLDELQGVAINNPQYKQVLSVNEEGIWVNAPPPSSINTSTEEPPDPSVGDVWFEIT
jgi:hypothetical protein